MEAYLGIDLGSTTSKAVLVGGAGEVLGRGITNTRSNYDVAAQVAREEAVGDARLTLLARRLQADVPAEAMARLRQAFGVAQATERLAALRRRTVALVAQSSAAEAERADALFAAMTEEADATFGALAADRSRFFRDVAGSRFFVLADERAQRGALDFDLAAGAYDRAIVEAENSETLPRFDALIEAALDRADIDIAVRKQISAALAHDDTTVTLGGMIGTGYGRQRLPFEKDQIQSEILCHGMGAHAMFPGTHTVLDIGGQDTKAIQLDDEGLVTSFQMNDRCAAGCGRYLGYIADEMNLGVHELGPLALRGRRAVRITSTCTVFAGVELREMLATGEPRENILLGLHRAIVLRALSLLARSGGVRDLFTFTGGVARNEAVVHCLREEVAKHWGPRPIYVHADSIYTGALGAALFARRAARAKAHVEDVATVATSAPPPALHVEGAA